MAATGHSIMACAPRYHTRLPFVRKQGHPSEDTPYTKSLGLTLSWRLLRAASGPSSGRAGQNRDGTAHRRLRSPDR